MQTNYTDDDIASAIIAARQTYEVTLPGFDGPFTLHSMTFRDRADVLAEQSKFVVSRGVDPSYATSQLLWEAMKLGMVKVLLDRVPVGFIPEAAGTEVIDALVDAIEEHEEEFRKSRRESSRTAPTKLPPPNPLGGLPRI